MEVRLSHCHSTDQKQDYGEKRKTVFHQASGEHYNGGIIKSCVQDHDAQQVLDMVGEQNLEREHLYDSQE